MGKGKLLRAVFLLTLICFSTRVSTAEEPLTVARALSLCQGNQEIFRDIDAGDIRKVIDTMVHIFKEKPREIRVIYRNFKYQQIVSYEGFNVMVNYIYDYKGTFRIDEVTIYRDIAKAISIYSRQEKIKQEQFWDSVAFNYKGFTYTLYGPFVQERIISKKSFFLIRQKYVKNKRIAFIFEKQEDDNVIRVKKIDENGDQDIIMNIKDGLIDIPQEIIPGSDFKLKVFGFTEDVAENIHISGLKCRLLLPDEIRAIIVKNPSNQKILEENTPAKDQFTPAR